MYGISFYLVTKSWRMDEETYEPEEETTQEPEAEKWYEGSTFQRVILPALILGIPLAVALLLKYLGLIQG